MTEKTINDVLKTLPKNSWVLRWMECWPTAEPPKSFILFSGLAALGLALGRKIFHYRDPHTFYPMFNLLLTGPSGIGKSTAAGDIGLSLIRALPENERPACVQSVTQEGLFAELNVNAHSYIWASELSAVFSKKKYLDDLIPTVTDMVDGRPVSRTTKSGGRVSIEHPTLAIIGCSTPEWLQEQLPETATAGGFLPRFIIVHEEHKGQVVPLTDHLLSPAKEAALWSLREAVCEEFRAMALQPLGRMGFRDFEARNAFTDWSRLYKVPTGHLEPFKDRGGVQVLRLAMLLAICDQRNEMAAEDIEAAAALFEYTIRRLGTILVGKSRDGKLHAEILKAIGNGELGDRELRRAMRDWVKARECDELALSLEACGDIVRTPEGKWMRKR